MDAYVVKIQFEDGLRRVPLESGDLAFSYAQLVSRTRDLFQTPATAQLIFTYTDRDGDVVTMAEDQDLRDALVTQALNPLRLHLAVVSGETKTTDVRMVDSTVEHDQGGKINQGMENGNDNVAKNGNADATPAEASKRSTRTTDSEAPAEQVVHNGVTCDDCGMTPITGPRYKSMTAEDYDLCRGCFEKSGVNPSDYIKIKRGRPDRRSVHFGREFGHGPRSHRHGRDWKGCSGRSCESGRPEREKQRGAEAVHHGVECDECKTSPIVGPRFKSEIQSNYDLCQSCFQKVASTSSSDAYTRIDQPVRYIPRYYRMVSPFSFYRFSPYGRPYCGRRIRRIVVTTVSDEEEGEEREIQKNAGEKEPNAAPAEATQEPPIPSTDVKMGEESEQTGAKSDHQAESLPGAAEVGMPDVGGQGPSSAGDRNEAPAENSSREQQESAEAGEVLTQEGMVAKLAAMGFSDDKLNQEVLRKNNFDLQSTLDDLSAVKNWGPTLGELEEMGFSDSELNKKLLAQNDGNVKAVVRELVRLTKEQTNAGTN